ncbi:MAG: carbamate kinase [Elusimicrobia bacterium HGW-Elusimicrobia-1]|jgi:carbamate kinase|nr:MAG: carbamate kinase [Elusimicrobia bacterium HGW-Elusimicrobia-1]
MGKTIVVAIGGNSLIKDDKHMSVPDQYKAVCETAANLAGLIEAGNRVVVTHGNGPQVGFILLRSEHSRGLMHEVPLEVIVADTQGAIGYQLQQALQNELWNRKIRKNVVTVVTQALVDKTDPAFQKPSKPIGQFYSAENAKERMEKEKWTMVEDAGRGWRRVVPSPKPSRIIESKAIKNLVSEDVVVISVGGGGIPVVADDKGALSGVAAVIDKDLASAVLAKEIGADMLVISTAVPKVYLNFGKPDQKSLDKITIKEAKQYISEGHFKPGSMLPKVQACVSFLEAGGKEALITMPETLTEALEGKNGTLIVR